MSKYGPRIRKMTNKFLEDNCIYYAAASCFFTIVTLLPFLLVFLNIIRLFPVQIEVYMNVMKESMPAQIYSLFDGLINDVYSRPSVTITVSTVFTIYAAGQGFMAIMQAIDKIYKIKTQRPWALKRLKSTAYTLLVMIIIVALVGMYIYGSTIAATIEPVYPMLAMILRHIVFRKYLIMPIILLILFTAMYMYVPNQRGQFWEQLPGAVVATFGAMLFSFIYSMLVSHSPQFDYMYGSISNIIFALFWLYGFFIIIFFGAEFNMYIKYGWIVLPKWMRISQRPLVQKITRAIQFKRSKKKKTKK